MWQRRTRFFKSMLGTSGGAGLRLVRRAFCFVATGQAIFVVLLLLGSLGVGHQVAAQVTFTQITPSTGLDGNASFSISTDGAKLVFESNRDLTRGNLDRNDNIPLASNAPMEFKLPYPPNANGDKGWRVSQGNQEGGHNNESEFAFDFGMPEGSNVAASAPGTVVSVKKTVVDTECGGPEFANRGNYILLDHGDTTRTLYLHLCHGCVFVGEREDVQRGQIIGRTGKTGYTNCGPHLHFQSQVIQGADWYTQSRKVTFADVLTNGGVPISSPKEDPVLYASQNTTPPPIRKVVLGFLGQPAPDFPGGVFASLASPLELNNPGDVTFDAEVDTTGDGVGDVIGSFQLSEGSIRRLTVPGFPDALVVRVNNLGDFEFVTGGPGNTRALYLYVRSSNSVITHKSVI